MRRFVTPADINGTGRVVQWDGVHCGTGPRPRGRPLGPGRVLELFPPPGLAGLDRLDATVAAGTMAPGAIVYPSARTGNLLLHQRPDNNPATPAPAHPTTCPT